jgi:hypothetical protein
MFQQNALASARQQRIAPTVIATFLVVFLALALPASGQNGPAYKVTVTNLTRGSNFAPILVASHVAGMKLFALGSAASGGLETLAEEGNPVPLQNAIQGYTFDSTVIGGGLAPGASATVTVRARGRYDHVSVAGMLVPTNDAFFAVNGVEGPNGNMSVTIMSPAYDAGTEENDEVCPAVGPNTGPCGAGPSVGEGYVHVHAGIHGVGSLTAADYDWRNPVAKIVIERAR